MKLLITGGSGFIGGACVREAIDRGHQVVVLTRNAARAAIKLPTGLAIAEGDLANAEHVAHAMRECDAVIHAAGVPRGAPVRTFQRVHVEGTRAVIDAASRSSTTARFINIASQAVAFGGESIDARDGRDVPYPQRYVDPYSRTKAEAEQIALAAHDPAQLTVISLRPAVVWGRGDTTILPVMAKLARSMFGIPQVGAGDNFEATSHIDNVVAAVFAALTANAERAGGKACFIVDSEEHAWQPFLTAQLEAIGVKPRFCSVPRIIAGSGAWLLDSIAAALHVTVPLARFGYCSTITSRRYCNDAAHRDLGYKPVIAFGEGLDDLAAWAREIGGAEALIRLASSASR